MVMANFCHNLNSPKLLVGCKFALNLEFSQVQVEAFFLILPLVAWEGVSDPPLRFLMYSQTIFKLILPENSCLFLKLHAGTKSSNKN